MREKAYGCGLEAALAVIGGKWKVLILWALRAEAHRFGELRRLVEGISEKMLIQHLKEMEADETRKEDSEAKACRPSGRGRGREIPAAHSG
jgi:DNA-binding HxlR family transcriptional regulator